MTKEQFMLHIKSAAAVFFTDEPSPVTDDVSVGEWISRWGAWKSAKAKLEVDGKRAAKARAAAQDLRQRAEAAGLALVSHEELVEQYDADLAKWRGRAEAAEAKLSSE
jgi:hypothetical protein